VQRKSSVADAQWMNVLTTADNFAVVPNDGTTGFFRVMDNATNSYPTGSMTTARNTRSSFANRKPDTRCKNGSWSSGKIHRLCGFCIIAARASTHLHKRKPTRSCFLSPLTTEVETGLSPSTTRCTEVNLCIRRCSFSPSLII